MQTQLSLPHSIILFQWHFWVDWWLLFSNRGTFLVFFSSLFIFVTLCWMDISSIYSNLWEIKRCSIFIIHNLVMSLRQKQSKTFCWLFVAIMLPLNEKQTHTHTQAQYITKLLQISFHSVLFHSISSNLIHVFFEIQKMKVLRQ